MELKAIETLILPVLEKHKCELVELKWTQESSMKILQCAIMLDDGSMDLETCSMISTEISPILDESPLKDMVYYLEVCSPGAERELNSDHDITRSIMKEVKILFHHPVEKSLEWTGTLLNYQDGHGSIQVQIKSRKKVLKFEKENIAKIRLAVKI
ncbi:MAG TPA: ribosome maturation factor RimP [Erysipelotrichaceae bacterium]|nr:ribosome maturation factor RimP [Erysipelotrichaceae bacterium]